MLGLWAGQVYGDPLEHPQTESYWGNVNPIGERSCYDEGKRAAECLTFDYLREHNLEVGLPPSTQQEAAQLLHNTPLQNRACLSLAARLHPAQMPRLPY